MPSKPGGEGHALDTRRAAAEARKGVSYWHHLPYCRDYCPAMKANGDGGRAERRAQLANTRLEIARLRRELRQQCPQCQQDDCGVDELAMACWDAAAPASPRRIHGSACRNTRLGEVGEPEPEPEPESSLPVFASQSTVADVVRLKADLWPELWRRPTPIRLSVARHGTPDRPLSPPMTPVHEQAETKYMAPHLSAPHLKAATPLAPLIGTIVIAASPLQCAASDSDDAT